MRYTEISKLRPLWVVETAVEILYLATALNERHTSQLRHLVHDFPIIGTEFTHMI